MLGLLKFLNFMMLSLLVNISIVTNVVAVSLSSLPLIDTLITGTPSLLFNDLLLVTQATENKPIVANAAITDDNSVVTDPDSQSEILTGLIILSCSMLLVIFVLLARRLLVLFKQQRTFINVTNKQVERLELALSGSGDQAWDWNITNNTINVSSQSELFDYQGFTDQSLTTIHPNDRQRVQKLLQQHLAGQVTQFKVSYRIERTDLPGQWIWVLDRAKIVEYHDDGSPHRMAGTIRDITELKQTEFKLKLQAEAIDNISDAIYIFDLDFNVV